MACKLKKAQVLPISIKNLEFQAVKEARPETNPKSVLPKKYHNFLDTFLKKDLDIFFSYQKYDHKIILEEKEKYGYIPL